MNELITIPRLDLILNFCIVFLLGAALGATFTVSLWLHHISKLFKGGTK